MRFKIALEQYKKLIEDEREVHNIQDLLLNCDLHHLLGTFSSNNKDLCKLAKEAFELEKSLASKIEEMGVCATNKKQEFEEVILEN